MTQEELKKLLSSSFNQELFFEFIREITQNFEPIEEELSGDSEEDFQVIPVKAFEDEEHKNLHIVLIETDSPSKVEKARSWQRDIIRKYINQNIYSMPSGILAVFFNSDYPLWRLSFVEINWEERGKLKTPPKRYSYLVG